MQENGLLPRVALTRLGRPDDLIGPALFFASNHPSYVTGQILAVDGARE
jgi:3-oxoacyl-[acyl-carrier protein] reductase